MTRQTALKLERRISIEMTVEEVETLSLHILVAQDSFRACPTLRKGVISLKEMQEIEKLRKRIVSAVTPKKSKP